MAARSPMLPDKSRTKGNTPPAGSKRAKPPVKQVGPLMSKSEKAIRAANKAWKV